MLLEFSISNYKSFIDEATFSMIAAPKQHGLNYSVKKVRTGASAYRVLSTSVLYGPNASGKTSLFGAMETLRALVLRGDIADSVDYVSSPNRAACSLSLIPPRSNDPSPTSFNIHFVFSGLEFNYSLTIDFGSFMQKDYNRNVKHEQLEIDGSTVFERNGRMVALPYPPQKLRQYYNDDFFSHTEAAKAFASNIGEEDLFLSRGMGALVSNTLETEIKKWFENQFIVIYHANDAGVIPQAEDEAYKDTFLFNDWISKGTKAFGIGANKIGFLFDSEENRMRMASLFEDSKTAMAIPAEDYESFGTVRFANLLPLLLVAIKTGAALVVDEFDASIHPMAIMNLISIFHNDEINRKGAQLIINTHNPILLNKRLFRRDEIKFVERDEATQRSELYALSDFGTAGTNGVRKDSDYMKAYFVGKYGAIRDIDFSEIFESLWIDDTEVASNNLNNSPKGNQS